MVVLNEPIYQEICNFINEYNGLAIECEKEIIGKFNNIDANTLLSILSKQWQKITKRNINTVNFEQLFSGISLNLIDDKYLLKKAVENKLPPISVCRALLNDLYKGHSKKEISELLKNPHLIPSPQLAQNVANCLFNDSRDGILPDIIKQCIGMEYEIKLKQMAIAANLIFYDEGDLRRTGFDKTPDLKLAIPCLYRGNEINWIESKALFGDEDSHLKYMKEQLCSYVNRFGPGLVIYWFGYVSTLPIDGQILIADAFPLDSELKILNTLL